MFAKDELVRHPQYGIGNVMADMGITVVVRFEQKIEECAKEDLTLVPSLFQRMEKDEWDIPLEVVNRIQAEAIRSINDAWGIFARSRIELLPHQLWVCRQVNRDWPTRWLVADDVGLGKTIEAGLILTPLLANEKVKRLLIICPASLVGQWQERLCTMFDIRAAIYVTQADTKNTGFWETSNQVIASLQTLRLDRQDRHKRLLESDPWDLLIVDEAHHLNADEQQGQTFGYQLIRKLEKNGRVNSMLFFTGTPHRGKDFGFLSLLRLLRPDMFSTDISLEKQLLSLQKLMIRNNKYNVTDLTGKRLFQEPNVSSETYEYSGAEQRFYNMLSNFIMMGMAYASGLIDCRAVMLVLISMQKLASSSVAAIRRAIRGRLGRIQQSREKLQNLREQMRRYEDFEQMQDDDEMAKIEENIVTISSELRLVENEEPALQKLLNAAEAVKKETKINKILEVLETRFQDRSVLFFTEYKATQSLLMSALIRRFGDECVTFINGDERADDVILSDGNAVTRYKSKKEAEREFNSGKARFLVSTEAGGEGIDLQENCYTLIHVDMPWNPMRMHQRVGRLNRYGQTKCVDVLSLRNPATVETRVWDKLNEKIERINTAFTQVMNEPEDMLQLVLGMTSPTFLRKIFTEGSQKGAENLSDWFDEESATFGGENVVNTVRELVGNVNKFDFRQVSDLIPRADLEDLRPFFETALTLNGRRVMKEEGGIRFRTPDDWKVGPGIRQRYSDMIFDRKDRSENASKRLLGVGHKIIDQAIKQAKDRSAAIATIPDQILPHPIIVFRIIERVTDPVKPDVIVGVKVQEMEGEKMLKDWQLLKYLNTLPLRRNFMRENSLSPEDMEKARTALSESEAFLKKRLDDLKLGFRVPDIEILAVLWPICFPEI
ncbi:MAG: type III restriction endonuclease subunit R [Deltaproteobacteria bacterium]|nr:MAG: type III restriction endonuclease subunit R [Deltaproteobacteria bacterium]